MALMTTLPRTFSLSTPALLVAFLLSPLAYADQLVESHITAVTVHPGVARVTREASFELPAGEQTVILHGLPAALDEASLQLEGKGNGLKIGAMEIRHLQSADLAQPEAQALKAKLTAVVETAGSVDRHHGGVRLAQKTHGVLVVVGADDFRMV